MTRRDFSFKWRILAQYRDGERPWTHEVYSHEMGQYQPPTDGSPVLTRPCEFDELVLGDWLHLEQSSADFYWLNVGDYRFWIRRTKGGVVVTHDGKELAEYGLARDL